MVTYNTPFMQKPDAGFRLGDIRAMWDAIVNSNGQSAAYGITAAGTTQATGTQLTSVFNQIDTAAAATGVNLPFSTGARTTPYQICYIVNNGASAVKVYAAIGKSDTINGVAGATGVSQPAGTRGIYISSKGGAWFQILGSNAANIGIPNVTISTAQADATSTTLANITGLTQTVVPGTYSFFIDLTGTCGGTGGWKLAFNYTGTVLSAIKATGYAYTASAVATTTTTTTTTQTSIIAANTAYTCGIITGTMTVTTGGTIDLQFAENSANSTSSIYVGSSMTFTRVS
jgi:hypothetical protein